MTTLTTPSRNRALGALLIIDALLSFAPVAILAPAIGWPASLGKPAAEQMAAIAAAHQRGAAVVVPLGLHQLIALHRTKLANGAIDRTNQLRAGQRTCPVLQGTGEKIVEGGVTGDVRLGRLSHVDAVTAHKPGDQLRRQPSTAGAGNPPGQSRQDLLRDQVLRQHCKTVGHRWLPELGMAGIVPSTGSCPQCDNTAMIRPIFTD